MMSDKRSIIVPGMPRAGTTFLFNALRAHPNKFNIPIRKETNVFYRADRVDDFLSWFSESDPSKAYIDVSPAYLTHPSSVIDRMAEVLSGWDVRIVLCLRNPTHQAFSHYIHRLRAHVAPKGDIREVEFGFYDQWSRERLWLNIGAHVDKLIKNFGRENIFVLPYPESFEESADKWSKLADFLDCDVGSAPIKNKINAGGRVPYYMYKSTRGFVELGGRSVEVPERTLILVNGDQSCVWFDVERSVALNIVNRAQRWTKRLSEEEVSRLYEKHFREDFEQTLALLEIPREGFEEVGPIETEAAIPGRGIFNSGLMVGEPLI